jgi:hypothetical protein
MRCYDEKKRVLAEIFVEKCVGNAEPGGGK